MKTNTVRVLTATALLAGLAACNKTPTTTESQPKETATVAAPEATAQPLKVETYNPGANGIFQVASNLIIGSKDAVLIDAQFSTKDAQKLVDMIKTSGKNLTTVYISHSDPDFYFGLETIKAAFPNAKILATPQTIKHIEESHQGKLAYWAPKLEAGAPKAITIPQPLTGNTIDLEGNALEIKGLDGPTPDRTFVWIPAIKTVVGGIPVMAGEHVWMADTQTPKSHQDWLATLDAIKALNPTAVIPGHFKPGAPHGLDAVTFTADYIRAFDEEAAKAKDSAALIDAMKKRYPDLDGVASLELSAKVTKGEMKWP